MAIPLSYNVRNVLQRPVSTLTTAIGIGLTVAILIGALALAAGFKASLVSTGLPENALVLREGADSEISSGISRESAAILKSHPSVQVGADGHPLASAEVDGKWFAVGSDDVDARSKGPPARPLDGHPDAPVLA